MVQSVESHMPQKTTRSSWDADQFLQSVMDVVPNLIYVFNHQTMSNEYTNRSLGEMLGYSSDEIQAMGATLISTLIHPADLERVFANFEVIKALPDDEVALIEYRAKRKNGEWAWLMSSDTVFSRDRNGTVTRHLGSAVDISAQKGALAMAQRAEKEAQSVSDELRAFAYSISHDMKAPSNTLDLALSELRHSLQGRLEQEDEDILDMAESTVARMGQLIEDVLGYTRVIGLDFVPEKVALKDVVDDVLESMHADIQQSDAVIEIDPLPCIQGNRMQIYILFQNLISNAIKFRKAGVSPEIRVACSAVAGAAQITVKDNGIGIEESKHGDIFKIFKRLHAQSHSEGQGLGLAVCKRIVSNHGSSMALVSSPGTGAAFTFRLPLA